MMKAGRNFQRYDTRLASQVIARLLVPGDFRIVTLGKGGCAFSGAGFHPELIPPAEVSIQLEYYEGDERLYEKRVKANLLYVRPDNITREFLYGFSFNALDQALMAPVVSKLEQLANSGLIERV